MSPHAVNSFVTDLVEMAKAVEQVPLLEEDVRALSKECEAKTHHIRELETNIIGYKQQIESLQSTIRTLEVSRDDAEYRFLEAQDREFNIVAMAKAAQVSLGQMLALVDPPKPEPKVEEVKPIESSTITEHGGTVQFTDPPIDPPQGQSEADPTLQAEHSSTTLGGTDTGGTSIQPDPEPAKYGPDSFITQAWWDWSDRNLYGKAAQ